MTGRDKMKRRQKEDRKYPRGAEIAQETDSQIEKEKPPSRTRTVPALASAGAGEAGEGGRRGGGRRGSDHMTKTLITLINLTTI